MGRGSYAIEAAENAPYVPSVAHRHHSAREVKPQEEPRWYVGVGLRLHPRSRAAAEAGLQGQHQVGCSWRPPSKVLRRLDTVSAPLGSTLEAFTTYNRASKFRVGRHKDD